MSVPPKLSDQTLAEALPARGWYPANRASLLHFAQDLSRLSQAAADATPLAVFDWDNTCIFNDIGDATFRYQLAKLQLRLLPEEFAALVPASMEGVTVLQGGISLAALRSDLCQAYAALWPAMQTGKQAAALGSDAHKDLASKLGFLYEAMDATPGLGSAVSYPWLLKLFYGFSASDTESMAQKAWQMAAAEPLGVGSFVSATAGASGRLTYAYKTHIKLHAEMADLMALLALVGARVCVVSASYQPIVRGVTKLLGVTPQGEQVLGMRLPEQDAGYPLTYRAGKVAAIDRCLKAAPILVAGDTNTDFEMLTHYPSTAMHLVIHRRVAGPITQLHKLALAQTIDERPRFLLQGRAEDIGEFWPRQLSGQA